MTWYIGLLIIWAAGLTLACLFFYCAHQNSRRCFCCDCGAWWEYCQCEAVECPECKSISIGSFDIGANVCLECNHVFLGGGGKCQ